MISMDNHVKFAHFVWVAVGEEAKQRPGLQVNVYSRDISFSIQCIIKQLLDSGFVISRIIKVSVRVISPYQPQLSASADISYLDLDYSGYHKNFIQ